MIIGKNHIPLMLCMLMYANITTPHWLPFFSSGNSTSVNAQAHDIPELSAQKKMMRDMSFEELEYKKNEHIANENYDVATKYLEAMLPLCKDLVVESAIRLELADVLYLRQKYKDAEQHYRQFYQLYRNDSHAEYALYRAICCCTNQICDPDRDQSKTQEAIELANEFLQFETFTTYSEKIKTIRTSCRKRLLQSGISVFKDYVCRKKFKSAHQRLTTIEKTFGDEFENLNQVIAQLEQEWSEAAGIPYPKKIILSEQSDPVNLAEVSQHTDEAVAKQDALPTPDSQHQTETT